ncbi:MAG: transporter substrate-binding protein [Synechococcales bacterium]|nr:transporter substrate-binding protein [Synechococcales bacterium]
MPRQFAGKPIYLLGSDYVFPRVINTILKNRLERLKIPMIGEDYIPLGNTEVVFVLERIVQSAPKGCVIINNLNGDTNVPFLKRCDRWIDRLKSIQLFLIVF